MKPSLFVRGDLDGFFGLFIDNLLQLMLIALLLPAVCGFDTTFVFGTILPGAALSILFGNAYYSWQAWRIAQRENRHDITAFALRDQYRQSGSLYFSDHGSDLC